MLYRFERERSRHVLELRAAKAELELRVEQRTQALHGSERKFRNLVEILNDGLLVLDKEGSITYANDKFCEMVGYTRQEILGPASESYILDDASREIYGRQWSNRKAGQKGRYELQLRTKGGSRVDCIVSSSPISDAEGRFRGSVAVLTDITEQKRAEAELRAAKEAAECADRAKGCFLSMAGHELRTPLNCILGYTGLLLDGVEGPLTGEQRRSLGRVEECSKDLLGLIDEILDFSKLDEGRLELHPVQFELREFVRRALEADAAKARERGLKFSTLVAQGVPDALVGDENRLRQVLVHLVENAVRFTDKGEVAVLVEKEPAEQEMLCLHFAVKDSGAGIPEEKLPLIFDRFVQADDSDTRAHGGMGLGLAISARLVEVMGGRIWAESELGRGSTFHFTVCFDSWPTSPRG